MIALRDLGPEHMPRARALLAACELLIEDIDDPAVALVGGFDGDALLGVVGLQTCETLGLLRSLAVDPAQRDRGLARLLCERVFAIAGERSMSSLWLLTTTASAYFLKLGFSEVARAEVPAAIASSRQFSALCPASACAMRRHL